MYDEKWIDAIVSKMTLDEKLGMIHGDGVYNTKGVERLGIPPLFMSDGPMGVRAEMDRISCEYKESSHDFVTALPCNAALAATWDRDAAFTFGDVLGREVRGRGKDMSLSPGINIQRTPLCGRNFEYLSEDPCLIKNMAVPLIKGIQNNDVSACVKHFALNNQEINRWSVSAEADERTLSEIYFPGFKAAVMQGKPMAVMGAYNRFEGEFCCENKYLLEDVLRKEWGFDGLVVSGWGAVHDTEKAIAAGCDIEMDVNNDYDNYHFAAPLKEKIKSGEISEKEADIRVKRILRLMIKLNIFDENRSPGAFNTHENALASRNIAERAAVLLKNDRNILPLSKDVKKIAVIGENGDRLHTFSGGSSEVKALYEITPMLGISMYLGGNTEVVYAKGYSSDEKDAEKINMLRDEALKLADECTAVIYIGGLNHTLDAEGNDRPDMKLPGGQDELIKKLLAANENTVIVNLGGSPVEMSEWIDDAHAVLQMWYSGSEAGTALARILFGEVNPSGKLPITFPKSAEDVPACRFGEYPGGDSVTYNDGIFVGYRYYDTYDVEPQFCFGHGLSYTSFLYDDMQVNINKDDCKEFSGAEVILSVTNTGDCGGAETVQVYVSDLESSVVRPKKELKGFEKVYLKKGETKKISISLSREDFSFYSTQKHDFEMEPGEFEILIGSSSRDIRIKNIVRIQ